MQTVTDLSKDVLVRALDEINSLIITGNAHVSTESSNTVLRRKIDALLVAKKLMLAKLEVDHV